ncbi:MAG: hypothetical protein QT03_C0001G0961 [archaeon GW2011_AR10]|nr:MAG: hypothetical protein QT03_C0001G0961 [archaeon GW2011_AR10]
MAVYSLIFEPGWDKHFLKMDKSVQTMIWGKIQQQKEETKTRHLKHGIEFYVAEAGQYRIVIKIDEKEKIKTIHLAGNHKQYEKWIKSQ